jgi:hypothetical protein
MGTNGILPAEGDFNEQGVLKAIFAQYIMQLINDGGQTQYLDWITNNINTGWKNRDTDRNLTFRNYSHSLPNRRYTILRGKQYCNVYAALPSKTVKFPSQQLRKALP